MLTEAQQALVGALRDVLQRDQRIEAAWLAGSLGHGRGDVWSDVDLIALCADGKAGEVSASSSDLIAFAKPVLVNLLFGGRIINVVTADWQRFDIVLIEAAQLSQYNANKLTPLFNRTGREPPRSEPVPYRTTPAQVLKLVNEFYRVLGLAPVANGRGEYLVSLSGTELLRRMTIDLMLEENGIGPADRGGMLHLNAFLTAEQRRELESLPPLVASRDIVMVWNKAIAAVFFPRARRLATAVGVEWPSALETATRAHLKAQIGLEI